MLQISCSLMIKQARNSDKGWAEADGGAENLQTRVPGACFCRACNAYRLVSESMASNHCAMLSNHWSDLLHVSHRGAHTEIATLMIHALEMY